MYLVLFVSLTVVCLFIYFQAPISITLTTASILSYSDSGKFSYECIYTFNSTSPSSPVVTAATSDSATQSITCPTPHLAQIPAIPASTGKIK